MPSPPSVSLSPEKKKDLAGLAESWICSGGPSQN